MKDEAEENISEDGVWHEKRVGTPGKARQR